MLQSYVASSTKALYALNLQVEGFLGSVMISEKLGEILGSIHPLHLSDAPKLFLNNRIRLHFIAIDKNSKNCF